MEFNQTGIDKGYMIFTRRRDDEVLVRWATFDFFRRILIDVSTYRSLRIMIGAGANALEGDSRGGNGLVGDNCFSLENISS